VSLRLSIFADSVRLRSELLEDAMETGFRVSSAGALSDLSEGPVRPLGDVVLVDCPTIDGATLAALVRLDLRAARIGASLIVSTSLAALDDVFACLDQSEARVLVAPGRVERLIALGQSLARPGSRVRELSGEDRTMLLRLSAQVEAIGKRLDTLQGGRGMMTMAVAAEQAMVASPALSFGFGGGRHEPGVAQALPPAKLVRKMIQQRQLRARHLPADLFADPAWDMLLDLAAAEVEGVQVAVTSLCIASGVPATTALRWIAHMTDSGLLVRQEDKADRRRAFIGLTAKARAGIASYFAAITPEPVPAV